MSENVVFYDLQENEVVQIYLARKETDNPMTRGEQTELVHKFINKFISGQYKAFGYSTSRREHMQISEGFWRDYISSVDITHFVEGIAGGLILRGCNTEFHRAVVDVSGGIRPKTDSRGRPPNSAWMLVAAYACRIIHDNGYPERQAELIGLLEEALDKENSEQLYSRENLTKLVRAIYQRRPS